MADKTDAAKVRGCLIAILTACVQLPMWCAIVYGILSALNADTWVWVMLWMYVPISFVLAVTRAITEIE